MIYDAGVGIASINMPESYRGKLYDPDFYRTATPEEVRELVGDRSLVTESTTYTEKFLARDQDILGINDLFSPVIPNSHVGSISESVRPVDVAREYSPSEEVIAIIERASGISREESLAYRLRSNQQDKAANLLEEYKDAPFSCAVCSILAGRSQVAELKTYLDRHPQADLNCTPQGVYAGHGGVLHYNTPLVSAMYAESVATLRLLRERGATLDSWRDVHDLRILVFSGEIADELFKAGGRIPQETCDTVAQSFSYANEKTYTFFMRRLFGQCTFSPYVENRMVNNAVTWNRPDLLQNLLARGVPIDAGKTYSIHPAAEGDRTELKRILADRDVALERE